MPYLGIRDKEELLPPEVPDNADVECPTCGDDMSVISSYTRQGTFVSRHFRHNENSDCPGESDMHRKWKAIAYSKLKERYSEATINLEGTVGERRADVLVEFASQDASNGLGKGLCVEVQHKHEDKDEEAVTSEFLSTGYSVLWLDEEQYDGDDVDLEGGQWVKWWLQEVPLPEEWSGYHDVIYWLRQTNYASVELKILIPFETRGAVENWGLRGAWLDGVRKRDGEKVPLRYPCASCGALMTHFVPVSYRFNTKEHMHTTTYWMDLQFDGNDCPHCGRYNNVKNWAIRTVSAFDQTEENNVESRPPDADSLLYLPCMQCGNAVFFAARTETESKSDHKDVLLHVEDSVQCSECGSVVHSYHDEIRIRSPRM